MISAQTNGGNFDGNGDGSLGDDYVLVGNTATAPKLFRLFGDADGDGDTDTIDFRAFRAAYGASVGSGNYNAAFDADGDGDVDMADYVRFRERMGMIL